MSKFKGIALFLLLVGLIYLIFSPHEDSAETTIKENNLEVISENNANLISTPENEPLMVNSLTACDGAEEIIEDIISKQSVIQDFKKELVGSLNKANVLPGAREILAEISGLDVLQYRQENEPVPGYTVNTLKPLPGKPERISPEKQKHYFNKLFEKDIGYFIEEFQNGDISPNTMLDGKSILSNILEWNPSIERQDVSELIAAGAVASFADIVSAIRTNVNVQAIDLLIQRTSIDVNQIWFQSHKTYSVILAATEALRPEVVKMLVSRGAQFEVDNDLGVLDVLPIPASLEEMEKAAALADYFLEDGTPTFSIFTVRRIESWLPQNLKAKHEKYIMDYQKDLELLLSGENEFSPHIAVARRAYEFVLAVSEDIKKQSLTISKCKNIDLSKIFEFESQISLYPNHKTTSKIVNDIQKAKKLLINKNNLSAKERDIVSQVLTSIYNKDWARLVYDLQNINNTSPDSGFNALVFLKAIENEAPLDTISTLLSSIVSKPPLGTLEALIKTNNLVLTKYLLNSYPELQKDAYYQNQGENKNDVQKYIELIKLPEVKEE